MPYNNCPKCGTKKHQLMACRNCGYTNSKDIFELSSTTVRVQLIKNKPENKYWSVGQVPKWVSDMIHIGYTWHSDRTPWKRRIFIISMPFKSTAAPLVALGALRKDLEKPNANNIDGHFDLLKRARDIYLEDPNNSQILVKDKHNKKWKFFKAINQENQIVVIDAKYKNETKKNGRIIDNPNGPEIRTIMKDYAKYWRLNGEPVIETVKTDNKLNIDKYLLVPNCHGEIFDKNLICSYNSLLLFGESEGLNTKYMQEIFNVGFYNDNFDVSLGNLLTFHAKTNNVRRISYCNQINNNQISNYKLVIAAGSKAILDSLEQFKDSDLIGFYSRDEDLALLANKIEEIKRYYTSLDTSRYFTNRNPFITNFGLQRR